ncbi:MAG: transport system ATP-binding/permease protein, partial [Myxococcales bacterium]|nr:transport system ATP-binding/permease protein [Myxococcales bacterium]
MSVLAALDVTKAYGERTLLDGASFTLQDGERVGVVGRNGAGKSTFAKILAGAETPDTGSVATRRGARVAYLAQEPDLDETKTVRASVEEGLDAWIAARHRHEAITAKIATEAHASDALLAEQLEAAGEVERLGGWERSHEVDRVLAHLGILDAVDRLTGTLSGGQRRR